MFSLPEMPATASALFSAYASFAASMILFRSMVNEIIPAPVRDYLEDFIRRFFNPLKPSQATIVVEENCGISSNEVYEAAELYLRTKISPLANRFKVGKTPKQKTLHIAVEKGESIPDQFEGIHVTWQLVSDEPKDGHRERKSYELSFDKKFRDRVVNDYLPFVISKANEMKNSDKPLRLYTRDIPSSCDDDDGSYGDWGSIILEHPSTFDTLAMDPKMKAALVEDLDRFVRRRDFYKKVGKAWKRGYLLYGPPGTGKSSLIAAISNHLKFNIYDLELSSIYSNSELRRILVSTQNRSIIVIEDIDCSVQMHDREQAEEEDPYNTNSKFTLSGLLNFIDGLWSTCGDERIIIFTTNHKDRLDPALLRPGRMDMHIHMSYCTMDGFKLLAHIYHDITGDDEPLLFKEIETLMETSQVTPAELAEELMKSEDIDAALAGVVDFLNRKKSLSTAAADESEQSKPVPKEEIEKKRITKVKKKRKGRNGKSCLL